MNAKETIYNLLKKSPVPLSAKKISSYKNTPNRTYTAHLLSELVDEGKILKIRTGKNITYFAATIIFNKTLKIKNLHEDEIWEKIRKTPNFIETLSDQSETSLHFAFTEMLNNAIDHSKSGTVSIILDTSKTSVFFSIRDYGIGVFNSLMTKKSYSDILTTIQELVKGKTTSDPIHHSGEGIFWTSKIADKFELKSYDYSLIIDNTIHDYTIKKLDKKIIGTEVYFEIEKQSKKSIRNLFHEYSFDPSRLTLDTTSIPIKLYELGEAWISRSQAKKMLSNLEKYKKIILDFNNIDLIGQGFADEVFRVFQNAHPDIILEPINTNETIQILINDARSNRE
ncbi:DUF4325 domain-containing protein [Candidatus Saccharibacteria bacterium]|nr:DUF4325 domain-containing protein [Candidatus Saccharibacteria bacterium]